MSPERGVGKGRLSAVLCLYGRVGNLDDKFDHGGSTPEALAVSAPAVWKHVVDANRAYFAMDVVAQTWDVELAAAIEAAYRPIALDASPQPPVDNLRSFGEAMKRATALKAEVEKRQGFRYDLVVLMRYDIFWRRPLRLDQIAASNLSGKLWTGHWCSVHAEDLSVRNVFLAPVGTAADNLTLVHTSGVFAPSPLARAAFHDYWFAASSETMDRFASWGDDVDTLFEKYVKPTGAPWDIFHSGHFYTKLHADALRLQPAHVALSYMDYTLLRWRNCELVVGDVALPSDIVCGMVTFGDWDGARVCPHWAFAPQPDLVLSTCPLAGLRATVTASSHSCGRF